MAEWPLRINITEEDFWAPYDTAAYSPKNKRGNVLDWASDNAWDDFTNLDRSSWVDYLDDLVQAFIPKAKARKITQDDLDRLHEAIQEDHWDFESIYQAFMDASTWAWEEAYTPSDRDLEKALEYAIDEAIGEAQLPDYWYHMLDPKTKGPKDWSPLPSFTEKDMLDEVESRITYQHEENQWDRFVKFDLLSGPIMKNMRAKLKAGFVDTDGEQVTVTQESFLFDLKDQFVDPVISKLGHHLDEVREGVDLGYRVDFNPHWKSVLSDKSRAKGVRDEILGFLKDHPAESEEE